jgi:hypothetical protein
MCPDNNCNECQGQLIAPICIGLDKSKKYKTLEQFYPAVETRLCTLEKPHTINIKSLSTSTTLTKDQIIQILIDEVISLKAATVHTTAVVCPGINWKNNCPSCNNDFCAQLQNFINTVTLKIN